MLYVVATVFLCNGESLNKINSEKKFGQMKEQMTHLYSEQTYQEESQKTKADRQLHQTVISSTKLMSIPRKQRSIWRLNMRRQTYSQVTTGRPLRCKWCDEDETASPNTGSVIDWLWDIGKH